MTDCVYYLTIDQQTTGPLTAEEIRQQHLPGTTLVWKPGVADWATLETFPELQVEPAPPVPPPVVRQPNQASFFLFGGLANDLNAAAIGGMGGTVAYFIDQLIDLGFPGFVLFSIGELIFYWGLLQIGRFYQLQWVRRGALYLMLASLIGWLPLFSSGFIASAADWLTTFLSAIGTVVAFVDLWALRNELDRRLVMVVVVGQIIEVFIFTLLLTSQPVFQLLEAANVGLLAWLFYTVIHRVNPDQATSPMPTFT